MLLLKSLTAKAVKGTFAEPPVHHHVLGQDHGGGVFRALRLGPAGLVFTNGSEEVAITTKELWELAETYVPGLKVPAAAKANAAKAGDVEQESHGSE